MIIYSVNILVDAEAQYDWVKYMQEIHIPEVMKAGYFNSYSLRQLLSGDGSRPHFNVQYECDTMEKMEEYRIKAAPALQADHVKHFGGRFEAYREVFAVIG